MFFGRRRQEGPWALLEGAQQGDREARSQLITDYTPFIIKVASQASGRYLRPGVDEEISVALMAFDEAVGSYDESKGKFLGFAQTVIKRRLIDFYRRRKKASQEVSLSEWQTDDEEMPRGRQVVERMAQSAWALARDEETRRYEIEEYQEHLRRYGIALMDLPKVVPKHRDARDRAVQIARVIAENQDFRQVLVEKQELPVKLLMAELQVSKKLIERHRKYIIAVALVLINDLPHLQSYVMNR